MKTTLFLLTFAAVISVFGAPKTKDPVAASVVPTVPVPAALKLDLPEIKEMISLLRRSSNNLNQIAKRVNQTGRLYGEDMEDILRKQERLWQAVNEILSKLSAL